MQGRFFTKRTAYEYENAGIVPNSWLRMNSIRGGKKKKKLKHEENKFLIQKVYSRSFQRDDREENLEVSISLHRSRTPWLVYIRLQLLFVPPRVRFWLILAFQLQLYTKTSSIGQQVILDSEASASLIGCWWGRSGSFSTPDEKSSFIFSKEQFIVRLIDGVLDGPSSFFYSVLYAFVATVLETRRKQRS